MAALASGPGSTMALCGMRLKIDIPNSSIHLFMQILKMTRVILRD
jgi:hypothetical protein